MLYTWIFQVYKISSFFTSNNRGENVRVSLDSCLIVIQRPIEYDTVDGSEIPNNPS